MGLKTCTNCRGNLADFVETCPYCGVAQPAAQAALPQGGWQPEQQQSNKAIASLICGVILCFGPFTNLPAIVLGHLALADIKASAGRMAGRGLAIAGLTLGYVGLALTALYFVFIAFFVRNTIGRGMPANETAAIEAMHKFDAALKTYAAKCPATGYPATLTPLGPGSGDCTRANLIEDQRLLQNAPVKGYMFEYRPGVNDNERVTVFALVAKPLVPGSTGRRYFYLDEAGIIREAYNQNVGPKSPALDGGTGVVPQDQGDEEGERPGDKKP